jgi:hypothetical protein
MADKLTHKVFEDYIDIYDFNYVVIFSKSVTKGLEKAGLLKDFIKLHNNKYEALEYSKGAQGMFIPFKKDELNVIALQWKSDVSVIVHECFHLVCKLMDSTGIYLEDSSEEAFAYALDYLVKNVLDMQKQAKVERKISKKS